MPFDPWTVSPAPQPKAEFEVEDPGAPGVKIPFVLEKLDEVGTCAALDFIDQMTREHVTGDPEEGTAAVPFLVGTKAYRLTRPLIRTIGYLLVMQRQADRYDFKGLLGMARNMPVAFGSLKGQAAKLNNPEGAKKAAGARAAGGEPENPFDLLGEGHAPGAFDEPSTSGNGTPPSNSGPTNSSVELPMPKKPSTPISASS